jgi:Carbon dioxide concentrating mechanism/carboxysome shell protein
MAAIGLLETRGLTDAVEALDAMCKDAAVELVEMKRVGGGLVTIVISGDVAAVSSSVEAGAAQVRKSAGTLVCAYVIPNPHEDLERYLKPGVKQIE